MAKYTVLMSCGHDDTVELVGKTADRERKIEYFKSSGLCKECYRKKMKEKAEVEGFIFNVAVLPYIDNDDGSILLYVWFSGNTKPYKDDIKSLGGYRWSERESANDFFSTNKPPMCWNKVIKLDDLSDEITKATSIGADNMVSHSELFAMVHYQIALEKQKEWKEKRDMITAIKKPNVPIVLKGHKWNQKIYGKSGNYSVYPDGEKVLITDEEAEEIKLYLAAKEEYQKKISMIKKGE